MCHLSSHSNSVYMFIAVVTSVVHYSGLAHTHTHTHTSPGVDPTIMGIGPAYAIKLLLERNKMNLGDVDLVEVRGWEGGREGVSESQ